MNQITTILIAEKDTDKVSVIRDCITKQFDCNIITASTSDEALTLLPDQPVHIAIISTDLCTNKDTFSDIKTIISHYPETTILPVLPEEDPSLLETSMELNLYNYLSKPYDLDEVKVVVKKAITIIAAQQRASKKDKIKNVKSFHGIIGQSARMQKLFNLISRIAEDEFSTVLIRGESGTGKELVAKAIHSHSNRKKKNFVPVNCAAIPDDLLESELFGHTKGAFTGATQNKQGRISYADGGTLFLDEIGDMKSSLQAKLLRVLQEKEFEPVGALKPTPVNTRILAATHCDLEQLVAEGKFREDLYYRLSVIPLNIPSLRERQDDISLLLENFIEKFTTKRGRDPFTLSEQAHNCLKIQEWRGNVRELENLVQHMSILYSGENIELDDLPEKYKTNNIQTEKPSPPTISEMSVQPDERAALHQPFEPEPEPAFDMNEGMIDFNELINDFESKLIIQAMKMTQGNKKEAARILNLKRTTLLEKIKKKALNGLWEK